MAYKKGDLKHVEVCPTYDPGYGRIYDSREEYAALREGVFLPHSCDAWVIGGPENIRQLIADLEEALRKMHAQA